MDDETSSHGSDCESSENRNNPKNDVANETSQNQKNSLYDRFWSFAESHISPPIDESSEAGKRRKHCKDEFKFFFEICGFGVAVIVAVIFGVQLKIMQRQLTDTHDNFIQDERAWMFAYKGECITNATIPESLTFKIYMKNTGKTPAINVRTFIELDATTNIDSIPKKDNPANALQDGTVAPDATIFGSPGGSSQGIILHDAFIQYIKRGYNVYIFGTVWYDDIFGKHHWSQYCVQVGKNIDVFSPQAIHSGCDTAQSTP
jgi:hypothetical protein